MTLPICSRESHRNKVEAMDWETGKAYTIEGEGPDGEMVYLGEMMTYLGELNMEWTFHEVHVFKAQNGSLLGLRNEDIGALSPSE